MSEVTSKRLRVALAIVGIAGVMAQAVGQRTNEFGVRLALGARPRSMLVLVLRHAVVLVSIGLGAGVAASPGGVGPVTTALLLDHTVRAAEEATSL